MTAVAPAVSVVVPVRNGARFLRRAIDSVLTQTWPDFELIVIDDGSTDGTADILSALQTADPRIRVIHQPPTGIVASLNSGVAAARADLIARLDADDISLPDRLEKQVAWMAANPRVAVLGGAVIFIDGADRKFELRRYVLEPHAVEGVLLSEGPGVVHPAVIMRKSTVERVGGYRTAFELAEDYDLWLRISEVALIANLPDVVIYYRRHGDQVSHRHYQRQLKVAELARACAGLRRQGKPEPDLNSLTDEDVAELIRDART